MELVYLWVEKYKNIENERFNFSVGFEFIKKSQKTPTREMEKAKKIMEAYKNE